jgi:lycopene cyclase domain-containing protein
MMKFTYLVIDLFTLLGPLYLSFPPRSDFYRSWRRVFPAMIISASIFVVWDMWFTRLGVWGFNRDYITGVYVGNLPLEEILFFICIPYACIFTFFVFPPVKKIRFSKKNRDIVVVILIALYGATGLLNYHRRYTLVAFSLLAALHFWAYFISKAQWLPRFYLVYALLLIPFLVVNGLLTGTLLAAPVVWYDPGGIMGIRLLTIPLEDIFYGMSLVLVNLLFLLRGRDGDGAFHNNHQGVPGE